MKEIAKHSIDEIYNGLEKYTGDSRLNNSSGDLSGNVVSGYQGWFNAPEDGAEHGWYSWDRAGIFKPGSCTIDLWPDTDEFDENEKYPTSFRHRDGSRANVFSAYNKKTVIRHFKWMEDYGIDGAFVQRFVTGLDNPVVLNHRNQVLMNCREGANLHGRSYNVMYDLSGITSEQIDLVISDWKRLVDAGISRRGADQAYQFHQGKPVVTVWGIGFNDGRKYNLKDCMRLVEFLKDDPDYGNNCVMLGVPTGWREQSSKNYYVPKVEERHLVMDGDCVHDKFLHDIIKKADIVSPWTVDRYDSMAGIESIAENIWKEDLKWCEEEGLEFMPVVFPGFSWGNLYQGESYNQIPRQKGKFLWKQYCETVKIGSSMIYQAMFDEVNEATAIFKCTNDTPVGESRFVDYEGLESDHYLWLVGQGGKMLRHEIELTDKIPDRKQN